jgi:hypothetical protein
MHGAEVKAEVTAACPSCRRHLCATVACRPGARAIAAIDATSNVDLIARPRD